MCEKIGWEGMCVKGYVKRYLCVLVCLCVCARARRSECAFVNVFFLVRARVCACSSRHPLKSALERVRPRER